MDFTEDPMDASFNSPDRPFAVQNPIGAPTVNVLDLDKSWVSDITVLILFWYHFIHFLINVSYYHDYGFMAYALILL